MYAKENYHDVYAGEIDLETYKGSITKMMRYSKIGKSLLDFGCGVGGFLRAAKEMGFQGCGIEYDPKVREEAGKNAGVPVYSLEELKASGQRFDIIHLGDVLEHIAGLKAVMDELRALLAKDGIFFIEGPLQSNASMVYWVASGVKAMKRIIGMDTPGNAAPTHLIMTNKRAQRHFFTNVLGYRCIHYEIYETGWPYLSKGIINDSFGVLIKRFIGRLAVTMSRMEAWDDKILGNRFLGIFQPDL
ncbi:MAG: class I SAM-dependent methyltransferase [Deltaproteobacteria bacterium]|nr:class I SAM-dependent methyltransferase [Deltaproteobacteria bacterium]